MVLVWNIWNRRNRWVHNNQLIPARLVSEYAQVVMSDFQGANKYLVQRVPFGRSKQWRKPESRHIKINVGGAWLASSRMVAIGVIARDHHGFKLDGCASLIKGAHSSDTIDSCAFERGVFMVVATG
ncbi:hypothetical protein V6N13_040089 [Hibiscus sabdariffa]